MPYHDFVVFTNCTIIMEKFPFSPAGIQDLLTQIYGLPDPQLNQEAASVAADFRSWIKNNFELESSQVSYLDNIDNRFIVYSAVKVQHFILNRLPITLIKPVNANDGQLKTAAGDKIVVVNNPKETEYSPENGYSEEEQLIFTISYT